MKHLHLVNTDKFIEPFVQFINMNFDVKSHQFFSFTSSYENHIKGSYENVLFQRNFLGNWKLLRTMSKSDFIYIHSLFNIKLIILLFFQPWLLKKSYWIVWGSDLYAYKNRGNSFGNRVQELFRKFVIKRFAGVITHVKDDYELAKNWYDIRGTYFYSFLYPSNLFKEVDLSLVNIQKSNVYIQVGNSADPSNNHLAIFEQLKEISSKKDIKFIVPLSYGNKEYVEKVILKGRELLGDKFEPLLNFLSFEEYMNLLAKIDVAVFNHERQQALGNISSLISLRKKVYIRDDITTWNFCLDHGLKVYSTNKELVSLLEKMDEEAKEKNYLNMKTQFSEKKLVEDWNRIFSAKK